MVILKLILGLFLLIGGAELLVKGASKIAITLKISPLVIGLTIVAFGTSSPELAVSIISSLQGQADIALGNVVGSNIFNVLFTLGISALIAPLVVATQLVRLDVPLLIGISLLTILFSLDGGIEKWEGSVLVIMGISYTVFLIRQSRRQTNQAVAGEFQKEYGDKESMKGGMAVNALFIIAGLALLLLGSDWLVKGAVAIAHNMGVSELVIGLTIIAAGTSLPEVATSVIASIRGERDIAVGNIVGSNIFNLLFILGITAVIAPKGIAVPESALAFDLPVMTVVALACLPMFFTGFRIDRWEGFVFLSYYLAYTGYIIMANINSASLCMYSNAMMWFVLPLTFLTLAIVSLRELRNRKKLDN